MSKKLASTRGQETWHAPKVAKLSRMTASSTSSPIPPMKMVFLVLVPSSIRPGEGVQTLNIAKSNLAEVPTRLMRCHWCIQTRAYITFDQLHSFGVRSRCQRIECPDRLSSSSHRMRRPALLHVSPPPTSPRIRLLSLPAQSFSLNRTQIPRYRVLGVNQFPFFQDSETFRE